MKVLKASLQKLRIQMMLKILEQTKAMWQSSIVIKKLNFSIGKKKIMNQSTIPRAILAESA